MLVSWQKTGLMIHWRTTGNSTQIQVHRYRLLYREMESFTAQGSHHIAPGRKYSWNPGKYEAGGSSFWLLAICELRGKYFTVVWNEQFIFVLIMTRKITVVNFHKTKFNCYTRIIVMWNSVKMQFYWYNRKYKRFSLHIRGTWMAC